ncbi:Type I restriction-modification system, specificity subunit S [Acinetobacter junii CIP 107470 = MTCC 11364]|uniref:Type I restriction-modification system, specificity subunit S n=1 Tax=Acinetobacter junii CIP 107470 = MTCC 11364 TaxID=1217666 RepID=S7WZL6_ACIJU|nr:restriction endonuclease subunit S [Acinetobacter junii]ENV50209.1 hypothetical protein F953_02332 [Acinetobacter junii CIP 107470 = MTCC 11364]EPR87507.1 Type I restriction-modification system, specificity subunit S [Acinetobacter junii CIP 107470 = MTCC 11364]
MVPNGWIKTTLGNLTKGSAFGPRFSSDLYLENGSVGVIRTTDLDAEGNINYSTIPYANVPESFDAHHLEEGDLLITRSGTCGIPCIFQKQAKPIVAGAFLIRFILNEKVNAAFLHALLKSKDVQVSIQNLASGGVQKNLTGTNLKKLELCIPPIPEQKKIAQILSTWDQAILATEKLLENSQQQKKALMQQLLTGKKRLLDDRGDLFESKFKSSVLKELFSINKGQQLNRNTLSTQGNYAVINGGIEPSGYTDVYNVESNTITISEGGNSCGYISFQRFPFWCGGHCYALSNYKLNIEFIYHLLKFNERQIMRLRVGSGLPNIQKKDLECLVVSYPDCEFEQAKIADVLSLADQEIETLQKKLDYLKQEKKALMQQLLTGKRRVKV